MSPLLTPVEALCALLEESLGAGSVMRELLRRSGRGTIEVERALGWPEGRLGARREDEEPFTVEDARRLLALLEVSTREFDAHVAGLAVDDVKRWLGAGRSSAEVLPVFSAYLAVVRSQPELLYAAALEFAARLGNQAALREEIGRNGDGDDDPS